MKTSRRLGLSGLLLVAALALASCGGSGGSGGGGQGGDAQGMDHGGGSGASTQASGHTAPETTGGEMSGMDMGETTGGTTGTDHGAMSSGDMARMSRELVAPNGRYSDEAFIDSMVPHHEGAVEMARVALQRAEHPEIKRLAQDIVRDQEREIRQLGEIRKREFGSAESTTRMTEQDMRSMGMSDPKELANAEPFDKAFIDDMTPHHESAIAMAEVAREETKDPEIRRIAEGIVSAQEREIRQMRQWREEWYPQG